MKNEKSSRLYKKKKMIIKTTFLNFSILNF